MVKSRKSQNSFMQKLKSILQNNKYKEILQIQLDNNGFIINDMDQFQNLVLRENYKHTNFNSFRRSLNLYGFCAKKYKKGKILYINPNFNINSEQLPKIQLKPIDKQDFKNDLFQEFNTLFEIKESQKKIRQQIQGLIEAQNQLHQKFQRQYSDYLKERIFQRIRFKKLERFCLSFYFNLQDQKFKNIIEKSLVIVGKTLEDTSDNQMILDEYKQNQQLQDSQQYQQQLTFYLERNIFSTGNSKPLSFQGNSPPQLDLNQSFSGLSSYFEI